MLYVNEADTALEREVLKYVRANTDIFDGIMFKQDKTPTAVFDFYGLKDGEKTMFLDVKVRDIGSEQYPDYFLSKEKRDGAKVPGYDYYMVYAFTKNRRIKIFDIRRIPMRQKEQTIWHKRAKRHITSTVYLAHKDDALKDLQWQ